MVATQQDALRAYLALTSSFESLAGKLFLLEGHSNINAAIAATAAGAATLLLEENKQYAKSILREGLCDFVVTDLNEAIRILKNEVRRRAPVFVVLQCDLSSVHREIRERGLVADLVWDVSLLSSVKDEQLQYSSASNFRERREIDQRLKLEARAIGLRWIEASERIFPRSLERWYVK